MARTILVTVGISLVTEKVDEKESVTAGFGNLGAPFATLGDLGKALAEADRQAQAGRPFNVDAPQWVNGRNALVKKLGDLWKGTLPPATKRAWSGAELASLSLLGQAGNPHAPLGPEDRVILLASQTPSGQFCAHTIAAALRTGLLGVKPQVPQPTVVVGLRAKEADLFVRTGLPNTAKHLADKRSDETLLVASGGYKGLLPYLTPIAMQLGMPLLYLYEESDTLLEIRPLKFPAGLIPVKDFRPAFNRIDPMEGRTEEDATVFWADVDAEDRQNGRDRIRKTGLVEESGNLVKLTATGVLACFLEPLVMQDE